MSKGKVWWVFEAEYVEEGCVAVVRARTARAAELKVRRRVAYQYGTDQRLIWNIEDRVELLALRISAIRRKWGERRPA